MKSFVYLVLVVGIFAQAAQAATVLSGNVPSDGRWAFFSLYSAQPDSATRLVGHMYVRPILVEDEEREEYVFEYLTSDSSQKANCRASVVNDSGASDGVARVVNLFCPEAAREESGDAPLKKWVIRVVGKSQSFAINGSVAIASIKGQDNGYLNVPASRWVNFSYQWKGLVEIDQYGNVKAVPGTHEKN